MIKNIFISSAKRNTGNSHNFHLTFEEPVRDVKKVKLLSCTIPVTWYNVQQGFNDTILFNEGLEYVKTKKLPLRVTTKKNIESFKRKWEGVTIISGGKTESR